MGELTRPYSFWVPAASSRHLEEGEKKTGLKLLRFLLRFGRGNLGRQTLAMQVLKES
jgi:hypothetical protein